MGDNTAETLEVSTEVETVVTEPIVTDERLEAGDDSVTGGEPQEPTEVEVVLAGDDGSQPDAQRGIRKRINKLNNKVAQAEGETTNATNELALERERNKLLTLALEQRKPQAEAVMPPDPDSFDDGVRDPKYVKALSDFNQPMIAAEVQRQTANLAPVQEEAVDPNLVKKQTKHYERANELGAKDFDEVEDKAISILGNEVVNHLIQNSDESHIVLYYLGKNPEKATEIAELIATNPVKATLQLGQLSAKLSVKPRANNEPTPNPDDELQGGSPSAAKSNKFQRKLDKAREDAQDGGSGRMQAIADIKKNAREAGVSVT